MKWKNGKGDYIVTLVGTLVALGIIVIYTFNSFFNVAKADAITIGETAVKERTENLKNFFVQSIEVINITEHMVDYMSEHGHNAEEIEEFLVAASEDVAERINKNFTGIYGWIDETYVDGVGWIPDEDYVPTERMWYTEAVKGNGEAVVVAPYVDAQTNEVIISLAEMLPNGKDVISLDIVLNGVQDIAEKINLNGNGYGFITDNNGMVVAHSDAEERGKNYLYDEEFQNSDMNSVMKNIMQNGTGYMKLKVDGKNCIVFSEKIDYDWNVVMIINSSDLFEKVERVLFINIILSLLVFGIVAYFCTTSYHNKMKSLHYAEELKQYQHTLEDRVLEQTKEIRKQSEEMIRMQEDVIEGMATLIESRDGNTGEHVRNTKRYVSLIVKKMHEKNLHKEIVVNSYINKLINAAALHDVGKIKISDLILNKPARLNKEEFEIMKTHSSQGGEIVHMILGEHADEELVEIASDVARYHHERWDGNGYPTGLQGENIPLAARIMAVADVFDALISKRVYKERIPIDKAFSMIEEEAGKQFDPEVVEVFLEQKEEILEYLELWKI